MYTRGWLRQFCEKPRIWDETTSDYLTTFSAVSAALLKRGDLNDMERCEWFIIGLPDKLRAKLLKKENINLNNPSMSSKPLSFAWVEEVVRNMVNREKDYLLSLGYSSAKRDVPVPHVAERAEGTTDTNSLKVTNLADLPAVSLGATAEELPKSYDLEALTKAFNGLAVNLTQSLHKSTEENRNLVQHLIARNDQRNNPGYQPSVPQQYGCFCCGNTTHSPRGCPILLEMQTQGLCHLDDNRRIRIGRRGENGPEARKRREEFYKDTIADQHRRWKDSLPAAGANTLSVQPCAPAPICTPQIYQPPSQQESSGYPSAPVRFVDISLGMNADFTVLDDSEDEELVQGEVFALEGQLAGRKRTGDYARARNVRTGRYRPAAVEEDEVIMQDAPTSSAEGSRPQISSSSAEEPRSSDFSAEESQTQRQETVTASATSSVNRPNQNQRRAQPKTMDVATRDRLKEEITNKLLAVAVPPTITLGDLMFMSPQLRSQVRNVANSYEPGTNVSVHIAQTQDLPRITRTAHVNSVNSLSAMVPDKRRSVRVAKGKASNTVREYARGLLKTKVYVHGLELQAVIDWGSSVNLIPLKTAQKLDLEIRKDPRLYMVPVDGRTRPFFGVAESLPISIGDITTESHCMIAKDVTADILLGRIWLKDTLAVTAEQADGTVEMSIFSEDRTRKLTFTAYEPDESTSVWEHQLWPDEFGGESAANAKASVHFLAKEEA